MSYDETMSNGIVLSGHAHVSVVGSIWCGCPAHGEIIDEVMSGGCLLSSLTAIGSAAMEGGALFGGSADISVPTKPLDTWYSYYPLDEAHGASTFREIVRGLDASGTTAGQAEGVHCAMSQSFDGVDSYLSIPDDGSTDNYTVSAWVYVSTIQYQRCVVTRGHTTTSGDTWTFSLGYGYLNFPWTAVMLDTGESFEVYGVDRMEPNEWHHLAATLSGGTLSVYVDGVLSGTDTTTDTIETQTNDGWLGRYENYGLHTGKLQDVQVTPVRSEAYLLAQHDNMCSPGWYSFGVDESYAF